MPALLHCILGCFFHNFLFLLVSVVSFLFCQCYWDIIGIYYSHIILGIFSASTVPRCANQLIEAKTTTKQNKKCAYLQQRGKEKGQQYQEGSMLRIWAPRWVGHCLLSSSVAGMFQGFNKYLQNEWITWEWSVSRISPFTTLTGSLDADSILDIKSLYPLKKVTGLSWISKRMADMPA